MIDVLKEVPVEKMQFRLLPSANPPAHLVKQHNELFSLWKKVWTDTLHKLQLDASRLSDEFMRQDLIAAIFVDDTPITAHLYSFFSIDSIASREHGYLNGNYPEIFFQKLKNLQVREVMSMEYMTVHPDWRKSKVAVHIPMVMGGLAMETLKLFKADAAIAPARRDHKVQELAPAYGGESLITNVMNHNILCDLLLCQRKNIKSHASSEIMGMVNDLWARKEYYPSCAPRADVISIAAKKNVA